MPYWLKHKVKDCYNITSTSALIERAAQTHAFWTCTQLHQLASNCIDMILKNPTSLVFIKDE